MCSIRKTTLATLPEQWACSLATRPATARVTVPALAQPKRKAAPLLTRATSGQMSRLTALSNTPANPPSGMKASSATAPLAPTGPGWSIVTSPNTNATETNYLNSVACASASDCWAVGHYDTGSHHQTLIEHWNGTSWAIVASPNASTTGNNVLSAVACASASECWAVGSHVNGNVSQTLLEQWNGTSWAIVASPNNGT